MSTPFALAGTTLDDYFKLVQDNVNNKFRLKLCAFLTAVLFFGYIFSNFQEDDDWIIVKGQQMDFRNGFHAAIVTLSTVGYGDIVPKSNRARFASYALIITGFMIAIL